MRIAIRERENCLTAQPHSYLFSQAFTAYKFHFNLVLFVHMAADTFSHFLGLLVAPANEQDRTQVQELARAGSADYGRNGRNCLCRLGIHRRLAASDAAVGIQLEVVKLPEASIRIRFATASVGGGAFDLPGLGGSDG